MSTDSKASKTISQWAEVYGVHRSTFSRWWYRCGCPGQVTTKAVYMTQEQAAAVASRMGGS